ncbi:phage-like element PBSX protein XkdA [Sporosarcina sp. NCCP-2716]|uniref:ImmA/IrrE family metallo-endopeptidase n=1 Tax=Sporosarcina sp. NCCP-2716 TaxID=2943679 RepID=UPI00203C2720|nr:ImmA/IrrE family metallo-endopeptidase [Sporosarcina sp. NCCP-2716]GKV70229.1 phage-like element PBSX protein XkdA [Sporosarcina sp. NCCP-2716]
MPQTDSPIELFVKQFYYELGIATPGQLDIYKIAREIGLEVILHPALSFRWDGILVIRGGTKQQNWQRFGHEICHYLRHCGDQRFMHELFVELQEYQATHFAYHFCVPSFMLDRIRLPPELPRAAALVAELFNVELSFAEKRMARYHQKLLGASLEKSLFYN